MKDKFAELTISALREGGYVIHSVYEAFRQDRACAPVFACSTIDEALRFIAASLVSTPTIQRNGEDG